MSESPRHADPAKRLAEIKYELSKPVQSQFIKSDCEWLVARVTDLEAQVAQHRTIPEWEEALASAEAQVAALTQDRDSARMAAANYLESFQAAEAALTTRRDELWTRLLAEEDKVAALTQERDEWESIAAGRGTRMDEIQARAEIAEAQAEAAEAALATTRQALTEIAAKETWVQAGPLIDLARRALAATEEQT